MPARLRTMAAANPASSELRDDGDVEDGAAAADLPAADEAPSPGRQYRVPWSYRPIGPGGPVLADYTVRQDNRA